MSNTPPTQSPGAEAEQHAQRATVHTAEHADEPACGGTDADDGVAPLRNAQGAVGRALDQGALRTCRLVRLSFSPRRSVSAWFAWLDRGERTMMTDPVVVMAHAFVWWQPA